MYKYLLTLTGLLAAASALPSEHSPAVQARSSLPGPDISAITSVPQSSFKSYQKGGLHRGTDASPSTSGAISKRWKCNTTPTFTWGETDTGGKGVQITNADGDWRGFYIYHNSCDSVPYKYIWINAGETEFVSLPADFEGRITRGVDSSMLSGSPQLLASWFELSYDGAGVGWADVSLIRGCDGGILTWSLDNSGAWKGFTQWILDGAPTGAYDMKNDGQWVLKYTENNDGSINTIPRDWEIQQVGAEYVYVDDNHGSPVISSSNGRFGTYWPAGRA
ncbi:hypothetical protein CONLIGDRAFT_630537 [Coniochaeta ligniaria NRRL 30616]|uniref:Concanavalin A-like lectin/glucanase n=1 Tax=Coniochaeta ligniaria NRRL 30616 TaxID=1408157 RepID=A0A1J7ITB4_9PEZI|nr:hypothetical protein CONLIGDRAFT_630537 [Coniochaeta ligniaria NRRL 30616]